MISPRTSWRRAAAFMVAACGAFIAGCATNPATGERHLNLTSEDQEITMGRQADKDITSSLGLYPDSSLQRYVEELGLKLAASSERPQLPWTFRLVDDPVVNAFALPGGFIYITRGILAHFDNEAQLTGVLGHEIGHVTAQHSVNRMAKQQLAQIGLGIGTVLEPELQPYAELASTGLGLLFLKFSRDDESQADELGIRYMTRTAYDPSEMASVMTMLERVSQTGGEGGRAPEWLATHPDPANRRERILELVKGVPAAGTGAASRDAYVRRLDGLVFGDNPREGFFKENAFFHPELKFKLDFPAGWKTSNQKTGVMAMSPEQDAILQLTLSSEKSPDAAANAFFSQPGLSVQRDRITGIHGLPATAGSFAAETEQGTMRGYAAFIGYDGRVYESVGYSVEGNWNRYESAMVQSVGSFDRVTDPAILGVQPQRIEIVKVERNMSLEEFNRQHPSAVPLETLALVNQVEPGAQLQSGFLMKRIVGERGES